MDIATFIISIFSFLISAAAFYFSTKSASKANKLSNDLNNINKDLNKITAEQLYLDQGIIELEIRKSIEEASSRLNEIALVMVPLKAKIECEEYSKVDKATLEMYRVNLKASTQSMLNLWEDACTKYLDEKVNKERFERNYRVEIKNLVERESLKKEYFDPISSNYKAILKVYTDWNNPEITPLVKKQIY